MAASSDDRGNERAGGGDGEQEERTDGWMATYADMVTLLLTFFVLMFALSNVDNEKAELFLLAMSRDGITAEQFLEIQDRYAIDEFDGSEWDDEFPTPGRDDDDGNEDEGDTEGDEALAALAAALQKYIDDEDLGSQLAVTFNGDFLMITLSNSIWFDSGMADITPEIAEQGQVIGQLLEANFLHTDPFEIVVAGHTDDRPINTAQYPSNWHLSNARATNFLEILIRDSHLSPYHFYIWACGEYRPIATNETPAGRQANRRVEVMITRAKNNPIWDELFPGNDNSNQFSDEFLTELPGDE